MALKHADKLSEGARRLLVSSYATRYTSLVCAGDAGNAAVRSELEALATGRAELLAVPSVRPERRDALLAGLWLWHDFLDESHAISQVITSATGSFWHAIMHRREGDFSNAKYWYARCRNHPALSEIGARVAELGPELG